MEAHNHSEHHHDASSAEEAMILLRYMYNHNKEHTAELLNITELFNDEKISLLIKSAAEYYEKGNELLSEAIEKAGG